MPKRVSSRTRSPRKRTSEFSTVSDGGMFESRPFVVQSKGEEGNQKDLKTSLIQAESYGHHLSQIQPTAVSGPIQAVFGKEERIKAKQFNELKRQQIREQNQNNKNSPVTNAFDQKHLADSEKSLSNQSRKVANKRNWGGGSTSGTSTVVSMNKEDIKNERRFQTEGLKMNEVRPEDLEAGKLTPRMGVNKPTKFAYQSQTSKVNSDRQGNRKVKTGKTELGRPVLGLQGDKIHHLHGVQTDDL